MHIRVVTTVIVLTSLSAFCARAELQQRDWQSAGDGLITYDTASGLEWLDVTVTANRSWNNVAAQLGTGGDYEGFAFATRKQVLGLFEAADLQEMPLGTSGEGGKIRALQDLWGVTWPWATGGRTAFLTAHTEGLPAGEHWLGRIVWAEPDNTGVTATYEGVEDSFASPNNGSALVRTAEPSMVSGQGTWERTLQGRDLDGDLATYEGYYDTALDITWLADAGYVQTSGYDPDGWVQWDEALAWVDHLNATALYGYTGWRLPTMGPINGIEITYDTTYDGTTDRSYNTTAPGTPYAGSTVTEMSHLYFNTLGNLSWYEFDGTEREGGYEAGGYGLTNIGPFLSMRETGYWYDLEYALNPDGAWKCDFRVGYQDPDPKYVVNYSAWAVHTGDIGVARDGDLNLDGQVDAADILLAQQYLTGLASLGPMQIVQGDLYPVTGDGQFTVSDYLLLLDQVLIR